MMDSVANSKRSMLSNDSSKEVRFKIEASNDESRIGDEHFQQQQRSSRRIPRRMSQVYLPRLITRDYPFHQSSNCVQVFPKHAKKLFWLYVKDWFHVSLRVPAYISFPAFLLFWYLMIWVFAATYRMVDSSNVNLDKDCGLGEPGIPITMASAYAFSLETTTTVGCESCVDAVKKGAEFVLACNENAQGLSLAVVPFGMFFFC